MDVLTRLLLSVFIVIGAAAPIVAETETFVPIKGFLWPDTQEGIGPRRAIGNVFQNPARLSAATTGQAKVEYAADFIGYDRYAVSVLHHNKYEKNPTTYAIGYYVFAANDLIGTREDESAQNGIALTGNFSDVSSQAVLSMGRQYTEKLDVGLSAKRFSRTLASNSNDFCTLDLGLVWHLTRRYQVGYYSRNALVLETGWNSGTSDEISLQHVFSLTADYQAFDLILSKDHVHRRVFVDYLLSPHLSLVADGLWDDGGQGVRTGFGLVLSLGGIYVNYWHSNYDVPGLSFSQQTLGLSFDIDRNLWNGRPYVDG